MKCIHISILVLSAILLLQLFLIVLFVTLQVVINPRNHPQEFSVIAGGEKRIGHIGEACHNIELNTFTPNIRTIAYLSRSSVVFTQNLEQILVNNTLEVGYNSSQLTYYGIPVTTDDEVNLNILSSNRNLNSLSVAVSVYEAEGFSQFLDYISQNSDPLSRYNLDNCLLSTGCVLNLEAELDGWMYVVFESTPTPVTLDVSLEATVRDYDLDLVEISSQCFLSESSPRCHLEVPTYVYYDDDGGTNTEFLPFAILYQTESLLSNAPPPSQALNVSVDLTWTCSRTDLYTYIILSSLLGVTSIVSVIVLIILVWRTAPSRDCNCNCSLPSVNCRSNPRPRRNYHRTTEIGVTNVALEKNPSSPSIAKKSYDRSESLPPSYDKALEAATEREDEPSYYLK